MDISHQNELLKSPLHQLELQTAKARSESANSSPTTISDQNIPGSYHNEPVSPSPMNHFDRDRDSIYSFDSVSTEGRLLDRLGLENEDLFDNDELNASRFERLSISDINNKNLFGGQLSRDGSIQSLQNPFRHPSVSKPISTPNSQINLDRYPSYKSNPIFNLKAGSLNRQDSSKENPSFSVKNVPSSIVHPSRNKSIDSFHASISADSASIASGARSFRSPEYGQEYDEYDEFNFNSSGDSLDTVHKDEKKSNSSETLQRQDTLNRSDNLNRSETINRSDTLNRYAINRCGTIDSSNTTHSQYPTRNSSVQSASTLTRNRSVSAAPAPNSIGMSPRSPVPKRSISDYTQSSPNGKSAELSAQTRTKLALQLRSAGKHREASYQLQIAANPPYNSVRAMYLYSLALKFGQGVKQNDQNCVKWLCRSVLVSQSPSDAFTQKVSDLKFEDLLKLTINQVNNDNTEINPIKLYDYYSKLPPAQVSKLINSIKAQADPMALVYEEIGNHFINGWGVEKMEQLGIKCLSISSSRGNSNSMVQLGEIWSTKTKSRKKDYYKASAWYRLSETLGIKSIGNSWIYKEKYLEQK